MISVIVTVYNIERYLRRCVDSILAQTYRDLEILLVDDGSTDGCPPICDEYERTEPRVRVIHKENGGAADARNAGLEAASGEWIGFVDGDDFIMPEMYETLHRACLEHGAAVSMCGRIVWEEKDGTRTRRYCLERPVLLSGKEAVSHLLMDKDCDSASWDKLYRRELFSDIRYPVGARYDDLNVTARLLSRSERVCHVGKALYSYTRRSGSITGVPFHERTIDAVRQAEQLKAFIDSRYPDLRKQSTRFVCMNLCVVLTAAYECRTPEKREAMEAAARCAGEYLPHILAGAWSLEHQAWVIRHYIAVILRLRRWRKLARD